LQPADFKYVYLWCREGGSNRPPVLILRKLLIFIDAQNSKNGANAVSTHVLHTRACESLTG
jgi:hypothetical protein